MKRLGIIVTIVKGNTRRATQKNQKEQKSQEGIK